MEVTETHEQIENTLLMWKNRAFDYEWMFLEQKDICQGYRKMVEELKKELAECREKV